MEKDKKTTSKTKTSTKKRTTTKKTSQTKSTSTKKKTTASKKSSTVKKTTPKKTSTVNKTTNAKKEVVKENTKEEIKEVKQIYKGKKLNKPVKKDFNYYKKETIKFIKNTPKYLKTILNSIKILLIKIGKLLLFILSILSIPFKKLWKLLTKLDEKDEIKKKELKNKKKKKQDELYNTSKFDLKLLDDELDRDNLELVSYKDHNNKIGVFLENRGRVLKFDMKKFNKRFKYGTLRDKVLIIVMLVLIFIFVAAIGLITYVIISAPNIDKDRLYKENSTVLYDVNGKEFARIGTENRDKVTYDDLPQVLVDAIVATEDSRFFQHNGVDVARFTKATIGQLLGRSDAGGASTLTMQLSKNSATNSEAHGIKGIIRKFQDIYLAVFVYEKKYTKEQILEFYVNNAYLGAAYGVQQASKAYYGKGVSDLNLSEAAMIAGLFQLPYSYNPYNHPVAAEKRRNTVLNLMERHGYISKEEKEAAQAVPIKSLLVGYNSELNEHIRFIDTVVDEVIQRTGYDPYTTSMEIYTTMNPEQQQVVNDVQNGNFQKLNKGWNYKNEYSEDGIVVIDVQSGAISAIGTGRNKKSARSFNYATSGRRHPGSTAKPVLDYAPAMEYLGWGTGEPVVDWEYEYTGGGKIKNWNNKYEGVETAKRALAGSRNIPALLTFKQTTNEQKLKMATDLGWTPETSNGQILETCSIGGFTGVTVLESAAAYATFARGGVYIEPYSFTKVRFSETGDEFVVNPEKRQAMSEETAYMITNILQYAISSGTVGGIINTPGAEVASKTGTSTVAQATIDALKLKGAVDGDVWQVAYTQDIVISMWFSYPTLSSEHYLTGAEGTNARRNLMIALTRGLINKKSTFNRPSGVTQATIELETYPVKLASEYTPDNLKSVELYNKNSVPTEVSDRFSKLNAPRNVKASQTGSGATITWDAVDTPNAVRNDAIRSYFTESPIFGYWAERMIAERVNYNNAYIGQFGYQVYLTDSTGTRDLGFTTNNTFNYNGPINPGATFSVKSTYSIFKSNQSDAATVSLNGQGDTPTNGQLTLSLPSCITGSELTSKINSNSLNRLAGLQVKNNNGIVTNSSTVSVVCGSKRNTECLSDINNALAQGVPYNATFEASMNGYTSARRNTVIKSEC